MQRRHRAEVGGSLEGLGRNHEVLRVHRSDHGVPDGSERETATDGIHAVVVEAWCGVKSSSGTDLKKPRDGDGLGVDKALELVERSPKGGLKLGWVDLGGKAVACVLVRIAPKLPDRGITVR